MDKELWSVVNEIFHAALEMPPGERGEFVRSATSDSSLQAEVESLLRADSEAGSYLEVPAFADHLLPTAPPLAPGDVLCARFRIIRFIAEGGMGHVFEAQDEELSVRVALKVIRPEITGNTEVLARFRQEVRLARQITHPNVVRTFDIDRDVRVSTRGEQERLLVFLTMEFLDGETLAALLKRSGPLPLSQVAAIACQVADALAAAHRVGVVHRDIKPANIMLVPATSLPSATGNPIPGPCAVITDFGLARLNPLLPGAEQTSIGVTGNPIGTLAYMAPEQLAGEPVSPATDVYAFGLVLFEMLTGVRAFPADALLSGLAQRLTGIVPSPKSHVADLPLRCEHAVAGCLQRDSAARFQNPRDAAALLAGTENRWGLLSRSLRKHVWRGRSAMILAVCISAVACFPIASRLLQYRKPSALPSGALVYFAPVENRTGDRSLNIVGELLEGSLDQSAHVRLLDRSRSEDILRQIAHASSAHGQAAGKPPEDASSFREVAMRVGASRLLLAFVSRSGDTVTLHMDLQQPDVDPARFRNRWTQDFSWHATVPGTAGITIPPQALAELRSAAGWVRHTVGESANDIATLDAPPENVTTANWQALTDYSNARKLLTTGGPEHKEQAIALLHEAVRLDPGFARAWADLGDNLVSLGLRQEGYRAYLTALNSDGGSRLSRKERDFIQGSFATDTRDYGNAVEAFRDLSAFYPNDFDGWFYQAFPLDLLDRPADALKVLQRAAQLASTPYATASQVAYNGLLQGDYHTAQSSIELVRKAGRDVEADELSGVLAFLEGRYQQAAGFFLRNQRSSDVDYRMTGYMMHVRLLAEQGLFSEALTVASAGLNALGSAANSNNRGLQLLDRAAIEQKLGLHRRANSDLEEAVRWNSTPDAALVASGLIGRALPSMREQDRRHAITLLTTMERALQSGPLVVSELARARLRGELLIAAKQPRQAVAAFRKADALDAPLAPRDYLARGLLAAAETEANSARARGLREEAFSALARTARRPTVVWRMAWQYSPGMLAGQMNDYLALARLLGHRTEEVAPVAAALRHMLADVPAATAITNTH